MVWGRPRHWCLKKFPGGSPVYPSENHCSKPGEAKPTLLLMTLRHQPWLLLQKELHPLKSLALFQNCMLQRGTPFPSSLILAV